VRHWRFVVGEKPGLPDAIVAHAALDFSARANRSGRSISIARLAHDPGSPGSAFRLTETALFDALSRAAEDVESLTVSEPGGLRQLLFDDDPRLLAADILHHYYSRWDAAKVKSA